jgi:hypothetical protein
MPSSGMLRIVAPVRTEVSKELCATIIRVTESGELGTTLALTNNRRTLRTRSRLLVKANVVPSLTIPVTLMMEALSSSETPVLTRAILRNIPHGILQINLFQGIFYKVVKGKIEYFKKDIHLHYIV